MSQSQQEALLRLLASVQSSSVLPLWPGGPSVSLGGNSSRSASSNSLAGSGRGLLLPPSLTSNPAFAQALMWQAIMSSMQIPQTTRASVPSSPSLSSLTLNSLTPSSSLTPSLPSFLPTPGSFQEALAKLASGHKRNDDLEPGEIRKEEKKGGKGERTGSAPSSSAVRPVVDSDGVAKTRRPSTTDVSVLRLPLSLGWKRQTYIREMTPLGIRGEVTYFSPSNKKLGSYSEVVRYLSKSTSTSLTRDHFTFSSKIIIGEFVVVSKTEKGETGLVTFTEEQVTSELKRLQEERSRKLEEERERREQPLREKKEAARREKEEKKEARRKEREEREKMEREKRKEEEGEDGERGRRKPVDDFLLEETRPLPSFERIHNLHLDGEAFANVLMVTQFLDNFHAALEIDSSKVPSVESLSSGLGGDPLSPTVSSTLSLLLSRCLLLPQSHSTRLSSYHLSSIPLNDANRDELLRLFLSTCDGNGPKLSLLLDSTGFATLPPSDKASILATLVDQLVCCQAVTRQLDSHLEELSRMKGDRWMREGKIRALRNVQEKRRKGKKGRGEGRKDGEEGEGKEGGEMKEGEGEEERPNSRQSETSEHPSRPSSPSHKKDIRLTPGIGQCEVLTPEEEAMDDDEMECIVSELGRQSDDLTSSINTLNSRVRVFPFGEDRFHRFYWKLPTLPILVESVQSGHTHTNPACELSLCANDPPSIHTETFVDPDVIGCLEDVIDTVVEGKTEKRKRIRKMGNTEKRGWWTVPSSHLDQWRANLHGRGMRERCVHRLLLRHKFVDEIQLGTITVPPSMSTVDSSTDETSQLHTLLKSIDTLENALVSIGFLVKQEKPGTTDVEWIKRRLEELEKRIDRKYIIMQNAVEEEDEGEEHEEGDEEKNKVTDPTVHWKTLLNTYSTLPQLALATQLLSSFIRWSPSPFWKCSLCFLPCSSPPSLCSLCSLSPVHPSCLSLSSLPSPYKCYSCLLPSESEGVVEEGEEEEKEEEKKVVLKRRAEPNSFIVPSSMVSELARSMLDELEQQKGVGPFLAPVDLNEVPEYAVMIEKPMDLGTVRQRVDDGWYDNADDFFADVDLVFSNCRTFNEDESTIGDAGLRIHRFFTKRWRQLKYNLSKRVKRMRPELFNNK